MSRRAAALVAWALWVVFVGLQLGTIWMVVSRDGDPDELFGVVMIGFITVGALIASRRPDSTIGWLLLATAMAFALQAFGETYITSGDLPGRIAIAWIAGWAWYVWIVLAAVFLPLLFPDGRLLSARWRPVGWLAAVALTLSIVGAAFKPGDLDLSASVRNPLGATGALVDVIATAGRLGDVFVVVAFVFSAVSLGVRFRRSRGVERQQLKWFAYAGTLTVTGLVLAFVAVAFPGGWRDPVGSVGWFTFLFASLIGLPVAVGIAVLRHRLYDIDLVIKRTLVYGSLTALLLAAYLGFVLLFRLLLSPLTGQSDLAVAGSTLAVAALFRPLRARVQATVDRRFYRSRYDMARTLDGFSARLRDQLDLDMLRGDLRAVVDQTMQPSHVSLWLRQASR